MYYITIPIEREILNLNDMLSSFSLNIEYYHNNYYYSNVSFLTFEQLLYKYINIIHL